ncbi:PLC-like phosphodiesterase [Coniophora puteana RWD-64-598 SS2]|uniref:Phosphoinositide phospholipase C n=1 Tax=Coniophora puteana (strain RWD-64-598) TaxID=741705 RepID=A0A5M3MBY5_CONPW|nr:PLC-like phosphodiesterase [Coniophora puteana RWD-64-598 SS2]EIW76526.1 PLC-like phosphodiesterase [Coniophora puteana RWD-64-598 SS2]
MAQIRQDEQQLTVMQKASMADVAVPPLLQQGVPMTKVSATKQKTYLFKLDPDIGQIVWESKKHRIIPIENIKELRFGAEARYYRQQFQLAEQYEDRWITIVYTLDAEYKTLHLIASTFDVFQMWHLTLRKLYAIRQELMSGPGNVEMREALWEKQCWKGGESQEQLSFDEVEKLCRRLNINSSADDLLTFFVKADSRKRGYLDFSDFQHFVQLLKARPEVEALYKRLASAMNGLFTFDIFQSFMRNSQKSKLSDNELRQIFIKYASRADSQTPAQAHAAASSTSTLPIPAQTTPAPERSSTEPSLQAVSGSTSSTQAAPASSSAPGLSSSKPSASAPTAPAPPSPAPQHKASTIPAPSTVPSSSSTSGPNSASVPSGASSSDAPATLPPASSVPEVDGSDVLTLKGFTSFLMSVDNAAFSDQLSKVYQDMTRPFSEYLVSSSHNTYLVGNQLVGVSTIEGYIRALLHSCRSVEIDVYDGDNEPQIFHGKTLTSKVGLREVCEAIKKYAFVTSPYPIIISAEVHCSLPQQDKMAAIMRDVFGDTLVTAPVEGRPKIEQLPSPEDLKGRILLKTKGAFPSENEAAIQVQAVEVDSSSTETSASDSDMIHELRDELKTEWKKARDKDHEAMKELKDELRKARGMFNRVRGKNNNSISALVGTGVAAAAPGSQRAGQIHRRLSSSSSSSSAASEKPPKPKISLEITALLVYTVGVKCRGLNKKEHYEPAHMFSLSESTANKMVKSGSGHDLVKHCKGHAVRVYPKGTRLKSTNYEPHRFWATGCQLVAINWQTFDMGYMINHAMFQRNGRAGYVLKPPALRSADKEQLAQRTKRVLEVTIISAQQLPRRRDSSGREVTDKDKGRIDPYVEVSVHVPEWAHTSVKSSSSSSSSVKTPSKLAAASDSSLGLDKLDKVASVGQQLNTVRTSVVKNNGFNPLWNEVLRVPFEVVGGMEDLVFVKFAVKSERGEDNDDHVALYCVSLGSLEQGYRHLPLHDAQLSQFLFSTLFVHINVRDA